MAYEQIKKISGTVATNFGQQVAIDGYYAISSDDSESGHFYKKSLDGEWSEIDIFTMTGATTDFGSSLDIGNNYFVSGDTGYSVGGGVGVYSINNPSSVVQILSPGTLSSGDNFGISVSISDNYILVGASGADDGRGDAYLYIKGTGATWSEYSGNPISASLRSMNDYFGGAVAISGDSLIIGAYGDNNKTGAIYIFEKNKETSNWEERQKILASDGEYNDQFGESLSADGNYFVAGASLVESSIKEVNAGAVYVYKFGSSWYEVDKLTGVGENSFAGNYFGSSVDINGDYIIVGSPGARATGVADVFYKKRSWGHLVKILGEDSVSEDTFGSSVSISGRYLLVGSPSNSTNGSIYYSENPPVRLRLAQQFDVDGEYLPSKASVYLKRVGKNTLDYWPIYNTSKTIIDSTNFSTIDYGSNIVYFDDSLSDFTGNGYMVLDDDSLSDFSVVNYPVRAINSDTYNLWMRVISPNSSVFEVDILLDGEKVKTVSKSVSDPSQVSWEWISTTLVLPDNKEHILGIRIKENGGAIDKIYIDASDATPYSEGPDYGESPYLTVHMRVYDSISDKPGSSLFIYDYKNSIDDVIQSDWYNFDINVLDNSHGYTTAVDFMGSYFMVMSCSGTTYDNFIVWEMIDNDEYMVSPSAFRF